MKTSNKIISLILIWYVFTATASAYSVSGYVINNSVGIEGATINYAANITYSNSSGYYLLNNLTGNIIINFTSNPVYYSNSTSINMDSNKTLNTNLIKKPTGTITGCVFIFGGINPCELISSNVSLSSNRIRWFF